VPIEVDVPLSDGWWVQRLALRLEAQRKRAEALHERYVGKPPLPIVNDNMRRAVELFLRKAGTNWERLIIGARLPRLQITGLRTPQEPDSEGDQAAFARWVQAGMKLVVYDTHKNSFTMGSGYVISGKDPDTGKLLVTAEDPRNTIVELDPATKKVVAGLKMIRDSVKSEDVAYLYMPGRVRVAVIENPQLTQPVPAVNTPPFYKLQGSFNGQAWDWDEARSGSIPGLDGRVCVTPFENEDGMAEFEPHIPLMDRIIQQILQRMTVITFQAFKQRAVKGLPKVDPQTGMDIDYSDVFSAEPNAIWQVPASADFWESANVDIQPILMSIRDDVRDLAAVSATPLYSITPDATNGSAEGASLQREMLTFSCEGHRDRFTPRWAEVAEHIALLSDDDNPATQPIWAPVERLSLAERGSAASQLRNIVPVETIWTEIMDFPPSMVPALKTQRADDMVLQVQLAAAQAQATTAATIAGSQPPPGTPQDNQGGSATVKDPITGKALPIAPPKANNATDGDQTTTFVPGYYRAPKKSSAVAATK
jgi:hypothetical protein